MSLLSEPKSLLSVSDLERELCELICQFLMEPETELGLEDSLLEAGLDSMGIMQLLILLEERWGVVLTPERLTKETFTSVRNLAAVVQQELGERL